MSGAHNLLLAMGGPPGIVQNLSGLSSTSPGAGAVTIELQNDGDAVSLDDGTVDWVTPSNAAVAAFYQARASSLAGDTGSATGTFNTWLDLSTGRAWGVSGASVAISFTLEIREKVSGLIRASFPCSCSVGA